ncbi:MAG: type II toxin-antitoxin system VapC family toxin, partial [bacterium]|nr:type II toxin-antitoxin system VapC family toxin [bacterium]
AVLSWLLGEDHGETIHRSMETSEFVVTSDLTLIECDRVLHRAASLKELSAERVSACRRALYGAAETWILLRISGAIVERARGPFPEEPIRSLDALHLASVLDTVALIPETSLLTLDERVRRCGLALGLRVLPELL